jgi:nitroimidazol reductase NimA-like FMN-containing flavoprotein (pyridoxamine 5'-phosphate oxidase superfamily)
MHAARPAQVAATCGHEGVLRERVLELVDRDRCLELLASRPVGRLVFTHRALPQVMPVNFCLDDGVVFRLVSGSTAAQACRDAVVAFHVDDIDAERRLGWSVTVVGRADIVSDPAERARLAALPLESWLGDSRDHFVRIRLDQLTGRALARRGPRTPEGAPIGPDPAANPPGRVGTGGATGVPRDRTSRHESTRD